MNRSAVRLSEKQAKERIKNPKAVKALEEAIFHENRVRFHGEVYLSESDCKSKNPYQSVYIQQVEGILSLPEKVALFQKLIRYPFVTQTIAERAQSYHTKVFKSKDAFVDYGFENAEVNDDFEQYLASIKEPELWNESGKAFQCRYGRVSTLWIADLPTAGVVGRAKPYFYTVALSSVVDAEVDTEGRFSLLVLRLEPIEETQRLLWLDAETWRIFEKPKDKTDYEPVSTAFHGLGYAPCGFLVSTPLGENPFSRFSPFSPVLGLLDRYLDKYTSKDHYELYASFALYWMFETTKKECVENGCVNGKRPVRDPSGVPMYDNGEPLMSDCPTCKNKGFLGAGTVLRVPPPDSKEDADLRNPIGMVSADGTSLDFNQKELERSKSEILDTITEHVEVLSRQQVNEKQVQSSSDTENAVLYWLSRDMSAARKHLIDTLGKLRYGVGYKGCKISFGSLFLDQDATTVLKNFQGLKDAGAPQYLLLPALTQLKESLLWSNDSEKAKAGMLEYLDPLPTVGVEKVIELFEKGWVDKSDAVVKLYFMDLVAQFESEYGSIALFLPELPFDMRVNVIKKTLKIYADGRASKIKPTTEQERQSLAVANHV